MKKVPNEINDAFCMLVTNIANLIKVKSIVTFAFTYGMIKLLSGDFNPTMEIVAIFSSAFGSIITYFFMKKESVNGAITTSETNNTPTVITGVQEESDEI